MDRESIERGVRLILEGIGEDPDREGLAGTPARVAEMYEEIFAGLGQSAAEHLAVTFDEGHQELVLVRDIPLYSVCEHHLLPFLGRAHVAYIPGPDGRICGLSKLARVAISQPSSASITSGGMRGLSRKCSRSGISSRR